MTSSALAHWNIVAQAALDEIEAAHRAVGGHGPGRRYATLQINHAYAMLLSSQFQGFCRTLHTEAADFLVARLADSWARPLLRSSMVAERRLDRGNPTPANLTADFSTFGMELWVDLESTDPLGARRRQALQELNRWRNAIAHQDWTDIGPTLQIAEVRRWRWACTRLATAMDRCVSQRLRALVAQISG